MKDINLYISEKLHIDKSVDSKTDLSNVKSPQIFPKPEDFRKMQEYKSKGSKPERLVATIKDGEKLKRRFAIAVEMNWREAISEFGNALVNRGIYKQEQVDKFIEVHKK